MEYELAEAPTTEELEDIVVQMIKEGWQPQGGIAIYTANVHKAVLGNLANNCFVQAMVREAKK